MVRLSRGGSTEERGAVAVLVALIAVVLLMSASLVIDLGLARDVRGRAQNAADASALAAGNVLYDAAGRPQIAAATDAARAYAADNFDVAEAAWGGCKDDGHLDYAPDSQCISFDDAERPSRVRVRIPRREVKTALAGLVGVSELHISARATATVDPGVVFKCSLCVLGEGPHTLGNGDATVTASSVHFNGSVSTGPNGHVEAIGDGNEITVEKSATGNYSPAAEKVSKKMGDPLGGWAMPAPYGAPRTNPCTDGPGVYGDATLGNKDTCTLAPGLYVLTGTWSMGNKTVLKGTGVTIYAACGTRTAPTRCAPGQQGGAFDATNSNGVTLTAGAPGFGDLAIVYDRNNSRVLNIQGNGETTINGTIYALSSLLYANGNSGNQVNSGSIIVDSLYMNGQNSHLIVTNGIDREWRVPPSGLHLAD
ncbi:pilus assembly protein TadG-related protein [Nocardioides nitrophenolicus]|uniref:pilus assembly protein TadG-related protein n=1 Tax=Nocardioides nitrophenolicus TaxID=60489 RepID=UPI001956BB84|nr:pilus assembly protein TadG-related protein [Nocardioides nitrophenolicus]MBM7519575.1 hypothetical protein [Nocardioides nitrophenolicus]